MLNELMKEQAQKRARLKEHYFNVKSKKITKIESTQCDLSKVTKTNAAVQTQIPNQGEV